MDELAGENASPRSGTARASGSCPYSPKCLEKLSEKGRKGLQRSPTDHPRAHFFPRIPAKFTLGALLVPLFGQFLKEEFCELRQ